MSIFEQLLQGWRGQGYELVSMKQYLQELGIDKLLGSEVKIGEVASRIGTLAVSVS